MGLQRMRRCEWASFPFFPCCLSFSISISTNHQHSRPGLTSTLNTCLCVPHTSPTSQLLSCLLLLSFLPGPLLPSGPPLYPRRPRYLKTSHDEMGYIQTPSKIPTHPPAASTSSASTSPIPPHRPPNSIQKHSASLLCDHARCARRKYRR